MKVFAERLRKLRKEKGLSQAELARELDVASNTISIWELGKRMPEEKTVRQIASYFLTTEEYLLGESEYPDLDSMVEELKRRKRISSSFDDNLEHTEEQLLLMYRNLRDEAKRIVYEAVEKAYEYERENERLQSQQTGSN